MATSRPMMTLMVSGLTLVVLGSPVGCATPETVMEREFDMLKREMASLHAGQSKRRSATPTTPYYDPYDPYGTRSPGQTTYGSNTPGGPPPVPRAPTTAPPPLPVVKLDPLQTNPFADGNEPPIRLGRQGRTAPPVIPGRSGGGPLEYDRIDDYGNLLGPGGQVVYRAGHASEPIDTYPDEELAYRIYEDPHESPASKVARGTQVPRIPRPGEQFTYEKNVRSPGVYGLDDGVPLAMPGHTPGVQPVVQPRVQQFPIQNHELAFDRGPAVRVEQGLSYGAVDPVLNPGIQPMTQPGATAFAGPDGGASLDAYRAAAPNFPTPGFPPAAFMQPAQPEPVTLQAPAPVVVQKAFPKPIHAPGARKMTKQKVYRGHRNKKVKTLYSTAMSKMKAGDRKAAVRLFKRLLVRYGNHDLADNALYWLGETAYNRKNWRQALTWFQDVVVRYPEGNKLPDAMLKSALCYAHMGQREYAVRMLTEVESLFQSAPVAQVARQRRMALAGGNGG